MIKKPTLAILAIVIFWGSSYVAIRIGLVEFSPGSLALFRYMIASLFVAPLYLRMPNRAKVSRRDIPVLFFLGTIGIGIYNITLNIGEQSVSAGMSGFIIGQIPLIAILLATIFLNERITHLGWVGMLTSVCGIFLISFGSSSTPMHFNQGIWFLLIAATCGAIYSVSQKQLLTRYQPLEITTYAMWFGTISLLGWAPLLFNELHQASAKSILWVVYLGIFPAVIAYYCWAYVMKCMPACKAVSYLYWIPGFTTLLGWLMLGEVPKSLCLLGAALTIMGAILVKTKAPATATAS